MQPKAAFDPYAPRAHSQAKQAESPILRAKRVWVTRADRQPCFRAQPAGPDGWSSKKKRLALD
jgi:hypothetical protein